MTKATAKPSTDTETPKKRSKLMLALFALLPLAGAGGGYAGWTYYSAHDSEAAEAEAAGQDHIQVSAVPTEIAAETSFTHSYGLAMMIARQCGSVPVRALKAASEEEARVDGLLVNLSWTAAARRTVSLDEKNCRYFLAEIRNADAKAANIAALREGGGKSNGAH